MPKLDSSNTKKSKLTMKNKNEPTEVRIIEASKEKVKPTSIRFTAEEKQNIVSIKRKINDVSRRKISESDVIRALVSLGKNHSVDDIYEAYKDSL